MKSLTKAGLTGLITIALVATAMFLVAFAQTSAVGAANHCTNYFPINWGADSNCDVYSGTTGPTWGQTSSTALRDQNIMSVINASSMQIWYGEYSPVSGYGYQISQGASSGYQVAGCKLVSSISTSGRCKTLWHN